MAILRVKFSCLHLSLYFSPMQLKMQNKIKAIKTTMGMLKVIEQRRILGFCFWAIFFMFGEQRGYFRAYFSVFIDDEENLIGEPMFTPTMVKVK